MNIKTLKLAFQSIHKDTAPDLSAKKEELSRSLIPKHSCGNVNLQLGRFSTTNDVDRRRDEVCGYNFTD
jgi:hypothetical protein